MKNFVKIIGKPTLIIFILGIFCGYFFITSALPIGILFIPICLFFFKFPKEKLSAHTNLFSIIAILCSFIIFRNTYINNIKEIILYFFIILALTLLGKFIKKLIPVGLQILSLCLWGALILCFLFLSCVDVQIHSVLVKILKYSSLFFSGVLGIPPSSLFIPSQSICHNSIILSICILIFASFPAILINLIKDFKVKYIDFKFSLYYIISLIIGMLLGLCIIKFSHLNKDNMILLQLSIITPSIGLFIFNTINTKKSLNKLKHK